MGRSCDIRWFCSVFPGVVAVRLNVSNVELLGVHVNVGVLSHLRLHVANNTSMVVDVGRDGHLSWFAWDLSQWHLLCLLLFPSKSVMVE
jgi:hypothetical protein